jgi:hypothetical protein
MELCGDLSKYNYTATTRGPNPGLRLPANQRPLSPSSLESCLTQISCKTRGLVHHVLLLISRCIASHSCRPCTQLLNPSRRTPPTPYGIHQAEAPAPRHSLLLPLVLFPLTTLPLVLLHLILLLSPLSPPSCPAQALLPLLSLRLPRSLPQRPPSPCLNRNQKRTRPILASWPIAPNKTCRQPLMSQLTHIPLEGWPLHPGTDTTHSMPRLSIYHP